MMELQKFVISVIEAMGGIVEPIEYALCSVLVPDEYSHIFQGRTEILLSFDFEVAQENPESEFITIGSYTLEKMIEFAGGMAVSTVRYVTVDHLSLSSPGEKIKKYLSIDREQVNISGFREVTGAWLEFNYKVGYTSDERIEENREVWINLQTGRADNSIMENRSKIFYSKDKEKDYPISLKKGILEAFEVSYKQVKDDANKSSNTNVNKQELDRELRRINQYYDELLSENSRKMGRKGISIERIKELGQKAEALKMEKERQLDEMVRKYSIKIDISLECGILYFIPLLEYTVIIRSRGDLKEAVVYYNPVLKEFDIG